MTYAQLQSGLILPEQLARSIMTEWMFGVRGAYRSTSPTNKNTAGWQTSDGSADADTLADLPTLREQSRDLIRNEALPAGAINTVVTAVVGTGVVPQSRIDYEFLGIDEEAAEEWERRAERVFAHWADSTACDAEGRLNFWRLQELVLRSKLESGDVFAVRRYLPSPNRLISTCWQIIEADRVSTPSDKAVMLKDRVRGGIELDDTGRPAACYIAQKHPGENTSLLSTEYTRIPYLDPAGNPLVLHVARRLRPSQTRGVPYLAPVIELLKQLGRYTEAEVTAAVISGMFSVFVKTPAAGTAGSPIQSMQFNGGLPGVVGSQPPLPQGNKVSKLQSGIIMDLAPGEEIQIAEAQRPNTAFDPFVLALLRQIGAALEIPFEILIRHFTASYSASRAALLEAWRFFLRERDALVSEFCAPIWHAVITEAIATGLLDAPDFFTDPLKREAWLAVDWVGQSAPQIDPVKEANAAKLWNELGVLSLQDIASAQGRDFDRTIRQIAKERKLKQELLPQTTDPSAAPAQQQQQPEQEEQDGEDQ